MSSSTQYDIIVKPIITENSINAVANKKYSFQVAVNANKIQVANAVEKIFDVKVQKVNIMNVRGKEKRVGVHKGFTASSKKAIVTLTPDSKTIEVFDSML